MLGIPPGGMRAKVKCFTQTGGEVGGGGGGGWIQTRLKGMHVSEATDYIQA